MVQARPQHRANDHNFIEQAEEEFAGLDRILQKGAHGAQLRRGFFKLAAGFAWREGFSVRSGPCSATTTLVAPLFASWLIQQCTKPASARRANVIGVAAMRFSCTHEGRMHLRRAASS